MKKPKIDNSGVEAAQLAIARANEAANNLQKNMQVDLRAENLTQATAGGTAETLDEMSGGAGPRRRRPGQALSSQLGINA